jgi:transcriptional regulator with XRE-family HTH domain
MEEGDITGQALANLKVFIKERDFTSERVALRAGMSLGTFNKLIRGARKLNLPTIAKLARALGRNPEDFLAAKPPAPRPMPAVAFEVVVVDDEVSDELYQKALRAIEPINDEHARTKISRRSAALQPDTTPSDEPTLAARVHMTDDASALLASKAATKNPQPPERKERPRQPSKRGASKRARPH